MRIGIDCRVMTHPDTGAAGGIGHYVHELVKAVVAEGRQHEFVLFFNDPQTASAVGNALPSRRRMRTKVIPLYALRRVPLIRSHIAAAACFASEDLDILHGPANAIPLFYSQPSVVTLHDLAIYDHPEWFPDPLPIFGSFSTRLVVPRSVAMARRVIAVSMNTKRDAIRVFGCDGWKIDVIHEGVTAPSEPHAPRILERYGLRDQSYVLSLATLEPRKNIPTLVEAFCLAREEGLLGPGVSLIIAGRQGWKCDDVLASIVAAEARIGVGAVRWIGPVSEVEKAALLSGAAVFAYPSFYEGFGFPPLEAMTLGTPVIASSLSSIPELCGGAALLVDPYDTDGLMRALVELCTDPVAAEMLSRKGKQRAAGFTWRKTALATLATYEKAAKT